MSEEKNANNENPVVVDNKDTKIERESKPERTNNKDRCSEFSEN